MGTDYIKQSSLKERIPVLESIHDRFIRMFRITLSGALRKPVDISVRSTEVIPFGDFLKSVPVPSSINLFGMAPLKGVALMVLETRLIYTLVDIFYGGTGQLDFKPEKRDYTPIEQRLVKRVVISMLEDFQTAWMKYFKVGIRYHRTEINPQFAAVVPQTDDVIVVNFNVSMGREPMALTLCMPFSMIRPLIPYLRLKGFLTSPLIENISDMAGLGYQITPLPRLVKKVSEPLKQIFKKSEPVEMISTPGKHDNKNYKEAPKTVTENQEPPLAALQDLDPRLIALQICNEHPQTIAVTLAHLVDSNKTAEVINHLPDNLQADITYRMAILGAIPPGVINEIEEVMKKDLVYMADHLTNSVGGIGSVAKILDAMDQKTEKRILKLIREVNPELANMLENAQSKKEVDAKPASKTSKSKKKSKK